ncbi:hypothetical protein CAPTEDRAFT_139374, partial [Capitella teleta]
RKWGNGPMCESDARLDGKVVIVTGANTGIGKFTALDMARRGAKVYMACRSIERATAAANEIKETIEIDDNKLLVRELDLGSLESVRAFVEKFKSEESKLDILINNAGTFMNPLSATKDGFEMQVGVNHLGHFVLTLLLIEPLKAAAPSRVVQVSSSVHSFADALGFNQMMMKDFTEDTYSRMGSYGRSKLYNILFVQELAKRLQGSGVTAYSVHPGAIYTEIHKHMSPIPALQTAVDAFLKYGAWPFSKDTEHGAQTTICAAVDARLASESGKYYW